MAELSFVESVESYDEMYKWMVWNSKVVRVVLPEEAVQQIGVPLHMSLDRVRAITGRSGVSIAEICESDDAYAEAHRWMEWYCQVVRRLLPEDLVAELGLPLHVSPDMIREITRRKLDRLPKGLKDAADILEELDF